MVSQTIKYSDTPLLTKSSYTQNLKITRSEDKTIEIDQVARDNEIKAINDELAEFGLKQRIYFNKSVETARKAYFTF